MRKMATLVISALCILCLLAFGCNSHLGQEETKKPGEEQVNNEDPGSGEGGSLKPLNLDKVISKNSLVEPLSLRKIDEIDLKAYSAKIQHAIIQNAMNGVVLFNCDQKNPDYLHPSIHTLVSYSIESQTYQTIYQFPDDSFVLADIAYCGKNYYAIIFDQVHQKYEDLIEYQVVTFEKNSYKVVDSGTAQSPFNIPGFHILDGKVYYVGESEGSYTLKELKDGKVNPGDTIFRHQNNSNTSFDASSLHLSEELVHAYLTHTVDDNNLYTATALTINNSEPIPVAIDTKIIALSREATLISYDHGNTLDIIDNDKLQVIARYNATDKKIHVSSPVNEMYYATMERRSEYQPIVFTFANGELIIRHLAEIEKDLFNLVTVYDIGDGKWGVKLMGEKVDQFFVAEPVYR